MQVFDWFIYPFIKSWQTLSIYCIKEQRALCSLSSVGIFRSLIELLLVLTNIAEISFSLPFTDTV